MKKNESNSQTKTLIRRPNLGVTGDDKFSAISFNYNWDWLKAQGYTKEMAFLRATYFANKLTRNYLSGFATWPYGASTIQTSTGRRTDGMRNCIHAVQSAVQFPHGYLRTASTSGYVDGLSYYRVNTSHGYWRDAMSAAIFNADVGKDQSFNDRAYWSMRPKFQSDCSIINSIFELKDFVEPAMVLAGLYTNPVHGVQKAYKAYSKLFKKRKLMSAKDAVAGIMPTAHMVSGAVASGVLTANLAVNPTIKDIISIHAAAQRSVHALAAEFKSYGETGAKTHFSENNVVVNNLIPENTAFNNVRHTGRLVANTHTVTAIWKYKVLWQKIEDLYPQWWGLVPGIGETWNMLPMSFVLDYFLTLGKSFEYMDRDDNVDIQGVLWCVSTKSIATLGTYMTTSPYLRALIINDQEIEYTQGQRFHFVTGTYGKYYKRNISTPSFGPALPKVKLPKGSQVDNLLALTRLLLF